MKALTAATMALMVTGTQALASAEGTGNSGMGLMAMFFIAFGVLVVLFQLVPGIMLLTGIVKGLFATVRKPTEAEHEAKH